MTEIWASPPAPLRRRGEVRVILFRPTITIAYCLLLAAYCLLLAAYCLLLTAYCLLLTELVPAIVPMALANLVGVKRATPRAGERSNRRALLTTRQATNCCTSEGRSGNCQLVTMLLPEGPAVTVITRAHGCLREGIRRRRERECSEYQYTQ